MVLVYPMTVEVAAQSNTSAQGVVIMLHGLGGSGQGWVYLAKEAQKKLPGIKFIFPTASQRAVTLSSGSRMTAWFDVSNFKNRKNVEDREGVQESKRYIEELVSKEISAGTPSHRIVIAGMSQGGAVALTMLASKFRLAGIIGLSTCLPLTDLPGLLSEESKNTPVFMGHGDADILIPYKLGQQSLLKLKELGADVKFETYHGVGHTMNPQGMQDVIAFLAKVFA